MAGSTDFPTSLDSLGDVTDAVDDVDDDHVNDLRRAVEAIEAKVGIDSSAVTSSHDYILANFFASGRQLWIYASIAPTGWSIAAITDAGLAVKGGSEAWDVSGGNVAGSHTGPDHTLIVDEMPAHTHVVSSYKGNIIEGSNLGNTSRSSDLYNKTSTSVGGDGAHNHGATFRARSAVGIIIKKT